MEALWLYFIVLLLAVILSFVRKWNPLGKIILLIYAVLACIGLFVPSHGQLRYVAKLDENIVTVPLMIFLLSVYFLFFSPFLQRNKNFSVRNLNYRINRNYKIFAYVYIILGVIYIAIYSRYILVLLQTGNWASNRLLMLGDEAVYPDNNIVEKFAILFVNYFQLLALIVDFLLLRDKSKKRIGILLLFIICGCELCNDIYVSSRGMLAQFAMLLLALYFFFYPDLEKSNKHFINVMIILLIVTIGPYLLAVTISRFSSQVINSLVYYFGQPPYVFALEVNQLQAPMYGRFAFGPLLGEAKYLNAYGSWDHMFYTFVGWLYADWGFAGTLVLGVIASLTFRQFIKKDHLKMCDIYILLTYYRLLIQGAFTIGRTRCYELIISFVIYLLLKYVIDRYIFVYGSTDKRRVEAKNYRW